ncbi:MAG: hypothetical protein V2A34_01000 [Lentisphaerota bacterium]
MIDGKTFPEFHGGRPLARRSLGKDGASVAAIPAVEALRWHSGQADRPPSEKCQIIFRWFYENIRNSGTGSGSLKLRDPE